MKRALVLFDLAEKPPKDQIYDDELRTPVEDEWRAEASVVAALRGLGYETRLFAVFDEIASLVECVQNWRPDLVFNLAEAFRGRRAHEPEIASLLELLGVRYTGARSAALRLCKDKSQAKKLIEYHASSIGMRVPRFVVYPKGELPRPRAFTYPAIVKPVGLESSQGIARSSFVTTVGQCLERVRFVHERLNEDALVEEFISGRELYVSLLGNGANVEAFPPRELFFGGALGHQPQFATYRVKWDEAYRRKQGIRNGPAKALGEESALLLEACRRAYQVLGISGYARLDLRLSPQGTAYFLEANPNPSLADDDDFCLSAAAAGLSYQALIARIIETSEGETAKRPTRGPLRTRAASALDRF